MSLKFRQDNEKDIEGHITSNVKSFISLSFHYMLKVPSNFKRFRHG